MQLSNNTSRCCALPHCWSGGYALFMDAMKTEIILYDMTAHSELKVLQE